jgi:hypothetical protein
MYVTISRIQNFLLVISSPGFDSIIPIFGQVTFIHFVPRERTRGPPPAPLISCLSGLLICTGTSFEWEDAAMNAG